jgi:hypothetical protein
MTGHPGRVGCPTAFQVHTLIQNGSDHLNVSAKPGVILHGFVVGNGFLAMAPKAQATTESRSTFDSIKIKSFGALKKAK